VNNKAAANEDKGESHDEGWKAKMELFPPFLLLVIFGNYWDLLSEEILPLLDLRGIHRLGRGFLKGPTYKKSDRSRSGRNSGNLTTPA